MTKPPDHSKEFKYEHTARDWQWGVFSEKRRVITKPNTEGVTDERDKMAAPELERVVPNLINGSGARTTIVSESHFRLRPRQLVTLSARLNVLECCERGTGCLRVCPCPTGKQNWEDSTAPNIIQIFGCLCDYKWSSCRTESINKQISRQLIRPFKERHVTTVHNLTQIT